MYQRIMPHHHIPLQQLIIILVLIQVPASKYTFTQCPTTGRAIVVKDKTGSAAKIILQ